MAKKAKVKAAKKSKGEPKELGPKKLAEARHVGGGSRIHPALVSMVVPISSLRPDPQNARSHPKASIDAIKDSLNQFGQVKNIVGLEDGTIIAGSGTLQAAKELGWKELAVLKFKDRKAARAYAIADNQVALISEWDFEALSDQMKALQHDGIDLRQLGFPEHDISNLLAAEWSPGESSGDGVGQRQGKPGGTYNVTASEKKVIDAAIAKARKKQGKPELADGSALALVAKAYLA